MILLIDDERRFADNRECEVASSTNEAIKLVENVDHIDELWLDYVLIGSDSTDEFLMYLLNRKRVGRPVHLSKVYIHTSSFMAVGLLTSYLHDLGVSDSDIVRIEDRSIFVNGA